MPVKRCYESRILHSVAEPADAIVAVQVSDTTMLNSITTAGHQKTISSLLI
jgi:hypothetical protein